MLPGPEAEGSIGLSAWPLEVQDVRRPKEEEPLISVVFLWLPGLDPFTPDEVQDRFPALAGEEADTERRIRSGKFDEGLSRPR